MRRRLLNIFARREPVADTVDRLDKCRLLRVIVQLAPDILDVGVDASFITFELVTESLLHPARFS